MKKSMATFFMIMFVIGMDTFMVSPLLPTLASMYHISADRASWIVSSYALGYALFALIAGPLSDKINRKKVMFTGMICFGVMTILCAFASTFLIMIILRFLSGISAAFLTPQVWASIPIISPKDKIVKNMGWATAGLALSQMLGLPFGGVIASFDWSAPFIFLGITSFVLSIFIFITIPSLPGAKDNLSFFSYFKQSYINVLQNKTLFIALSAYLLFQLGNFTAFSFVGTWLTDSYSFNVKEVGISMFAIGLGNLTGSMMGSRIVKKIGMARTLLSGLSGIAMMYIFITLVHSMMYVEVLFFVIFLLAGMILPLMMATLQNIIPSSRGTVSSLTNATMNLGITLGAVIGGTLYVHLSGFLSISLFCAFLFISSALVWKPLMKIRLF